VKKAIALKGRRSIGKSQTIRTVDELLRGKYPGATVEQERRTKAELRVVLSIDGVKIGIESHGDPNSRLIKESLDLFVRLGCEIIICATRTKGETVTAVIELPGYEVVWLDQQAHSDPIERVFSNLQADSGRNRKINSFSKTRSTSPRSGSLTSCTALLSF
jgi:hypothetical protein